MQFFIQKQNFPSPSEKPSKKDPLSLERQNSKSDFDVRSKEAKKSLSKTSASSLSTPKLKKKMVRVNYLSAQPDGLGNDEDLSDDGVFFNSYCEKENHNRFSNPGTSLSKVSMKFLEYLFTKNAGWTFNFIRTRLIWKLWHQRRVETAVGVVLNPIHPREDLLEKDLWSQGDKFESLGHSLVSSSLKIWSRFLLFTNCISFSHC